MANKRHKIWLKRAAALALAVTMGLQTLPAALAASGQRWLQQAGVDIGFDQNSGQLTWLQGPADTEASRWRYEYSGDTLTAVRKAVQGLGGGMQEMAVEYGYDAAGRLAAITHTNTNEYSTRYTLGYDAAGRLQSSTAGGRLLASLLYDEAGNLAGVRYGNGDAVDHTSDAAGNVSAAAWPGGGAEYQYDSAGRITVAQDQASGLYARYTYDSAGRLATAVCGDAQGSWQTAYSYDSAGRLLAAEQTDAGGTVRRTACTYNADGALATVTAGDMAIHYTYQNGVCSSLYVTWQGQQVCSATLTRLQQEQGEAQVWQYDTAAGASGAYGILADATGRIAATNTDGKASWYTYDSAGQLVREDNAATGYSYTYTYDAGGNLLCRQQYAYTTGTLGQPLQTAEYSYDTTGWGDLLTAAGGRQVQSDAIGNILSDGVNTYTWARGRVLTAAATPTGKVQYTYDAEGRLAGKAANGTAWRYVYQNGKLCTAAGGEDTLHIYYSPAGPAMLEHNGALYLYLLSAQGDVQALMDTAGNIVVRYQYDAWGRLLGCTGALAATLGRLNPLRYRGYLYDEDTGLYWLQSRWYDPALGRFISCDSQLANVGGNILGANLFAYCFNDPVNLVDPEGAWPRQFTAWYFWLQAALGLVTVNITALWRAALAAAVYGLQKLHYDLRAALNIDLPATPEEAKALGWFGPDTDPVGPSSLFHQFTGQGWFSNVKYVSPDGLREAIYNAWGELVEDVRDIGTYNFFPSGTKLGNCLHTLLDVVPWIIFGNGDGDPGPIIGTVLKLFGC